MIARFSLAAVLSGVCLAADTQFEGPKLGYVYDQQAAAVRPILGIPGAALFGAPLVSGLQQAVVAPSQDFAIGIFGSESAVGLLNLASGELRALDGAKSAPSRIVFSPNGSAAALVNGTVVQVFSGLPANATAGAASELPAEPAVLAVSDDGTLLLAGIAESDEATALYSYGSDGSAHRILSAGKIASLEFLNRSHDAVFADTIANKIILLKGGADAAVVATIDNPSAVSPTADNRRILVASAAAKTITIVSLEDGVSVTAACSCEPVMLAHLQDKAIFRITDINSGPTWILDMNGAEPRVLFIPQAGAANE